MNILLAIHHHLDPNAGAPGATLQVGQHYQEAGHTVQYYSFDHVPKRVSGFSEVLFPGLLAAHLNQVVRQQSFDVVDAATGDAWVWGAFFKKAHRPRPLLVTQSHGLEHIAHLGYLEESRRGNLHLSWKYPIYRGGLHLWEVATSLRCADVVLMLNHHEADYATNVLGVSPDRVHIVGHGIPENFLNLPFASMPESPEAEIAIALVGTYIPRKGIQYSSPALNTILARHPRVRVSFFGTCCPDERVYADFQPEFHDRIRIRSRYPHDQLPQLLQGHQILLFSSFSEGFGLAILEAMACGLAPISTNIPGPTEFVMHEENGILIPPRDQQAIEWALETLITNRAHLEKIRQQAYATAQNYSWSIIAQQRLAIYTQALERKRFS